MKLTYNGTVIAVEPDLLGLDAIQGFESEGSQVVDWAPYTRAKYQEPFPRDQRKVTLTGTIEPPPAATLAARLLALSMAFDSFPSSGDLVKQVGTQLITYPGAVLATYKPLKDRNGVSYGYELSFAVGAPAPSQDVPIIDSQSDQAIESQAGQPLTPQS